LFLTRMKASKNMSGERVGYKKNDDWNNFRVWHI
jgi:hypothetical protein